MSYKNFKSYGEWINYCFKNNIILNRKTRLEAIKYFFSIEYKN